MGILEQSILEQGLSMEIFRTTWMGMFFSSIAAMETFYPECNPALQ